MPLVKICDWEVTPNTTLYSDVDINTDEIVTFVIHESKNQFRELIAYLKTLDYQIGFNNLGFDSQLQQFSIDNADWLELLPAEQIAKEIYDYAQKIIKRQDSFTDKFKLDYPEFKLSIPQLDLYKIYHFDNIAKKQSLKALQCNLNYWNVQDMPFQHGDYLTADQVQQLIDYNKNDILSTKFLFKKSTEKIELRKHLRKLYGIPCLNWSDSKIGEELVFKFYCDYINGDYREVKNGRTKRNIIALKDCILSNISFKTPEFNKVLNIISNIEVDANDTKKKEKIFTKYKGLEIDYGNGGVHASLQGVFEESEEEMIYDIDVKSLYPSIAIVNEFYPEHLGKEFCKVYKEKIIDLRFAEQAKPEEIRNKSIILALKNAANSVYGKSNSKYSFLYDPKYTLNTTVTGQLQVSMLAEQLGENLDCKIIQINTDGITILLKRKDEKRFREICDNWEKFTKLTLEYVTYKKMYIRDVNNYIAIGTNGKVKNKGCFEHDYSKSDNFHKDCSFRIVPLALEEYVVKGTPIETFVRNHDKIWDFLGRVKFQKNMHGQITFFKDKKVIQTNTQKVTRYFISTDGGYFQKIFDDGRNPSLEKGFRVTEANIITDENAKNYNINYRYYEKECEKIIDAVESRFSKINGKKKKIGNRKQLVML